MAYRIIPASERRRAAEGRHILQSARLGAFVAGVLLGLLIGVVAVWMARPDCPVPDLPVLPDDVSIRVVTCA